MHLPGNHPGRTKTLLKRLYPDVCWKGKTDEHHLNILCYVLVHITYNI